MNRLVTDDGISHQLIHAQSGDESRQLGRPFVVEAGGQVTLLFDFAAAASVRETIDGWIIDPQIFAKGLDQPNPEFADLRGTVREVDGDALTPPAGQVLGAFLRDNEGDLIELAEVDTETGQFRMPAVVVGRYYLTIQFAGIDWVPAGGPLVASRRVDLHANQVATITVDVDR